MRGVRLSPRISAAPQLESNAAPCHPSHFGTVVSPATTGTILFEVGSGLASQNEDSFKLLARDLHAADSGRSTE